MAVRKKKQRCYARITGFLKKKLCIRNEAQKEKNKREGGRKPVETPKNSVCILENLAGIAKTGGGRGVIGAECSRKEREAGQ